MDDLPELPFEKMLSYLNLEDRLRLRAVSKRWRNKIDSFRVKSLFCSERPSGFIKQKSRWVRGAFIQNCINSLRFESFFNAFERSILSSLKHLRLCELRPSAENRATFTEVLNSFGQLEELDVIRFNRSYPRADLGIVLELNLPKLNSIQLVGVYGIEKIVLNSPTLRNVRLVHSSYSLRLHLVHAKRVERLTTDRLEHIRMMDLENLKYLCTNCYFRIDETFLCDLSKLEKVNLEDRELCDELFEQKHRYGRTDLKIYFFGLLVNDPADLAIHRFNNLEDAFVQLTENPSRLADEIPFYKFRYYSAIERAAAGSEIFVLKRFTDLKEIIVEERVQDVQRFLNLLKNVKNIVKLEFECDQPQELFDRLPEHSAVQKLEVGGRLSDLRFLSRLKHLLYVYLDTSVHVDFEFVRKIFKELEFLSFFSFYFMSKFVAIGIEHPKQFKVSVGRKAWSNVSDLSAAIEFIIEKTRQNN